MFVFSRPLFSQEPARKKRAAGQSRQENMLALSVSCAVQCVWLCDQIGAFPSLFAAIVSWSVRIFPPLLPATHDINTYLLHAYMNVFYYCMQIARLVGIQYMYCVSWRAFPEPSPNCLPRVMSSELQQQFAPTYLPAQIRQHPIKMQEVSVGVQRLPRPLGTAKENQSSVRAAVKARSVHTAGQSEDLMCAQPSASEPMEVAPPVPEGEGEDVGVSSRGPLPQLSWANSGELWTEMRAKDVSKTAPEDGLRTLHPDILPSMRTILLDWLMEVCVCVCRCF